MSDKNVNSTSSRTKPFSHANQPLSNIEEKKSYTLKDLAKYTGFSKSTISRAFTHPEKVKKSSLKKIQTAVDKLGYQPSRVAQRLRSGQGKAKVMGLIIPDIMNPFFADITRGIEDFAHTNGYVLILNNSNGDLERQKMCLETLRMESVDGVILPPVSESDRYVEGLVNEGFVVVCVDRRLKNVPVDSVVSDNRKGAYIATSHMIKLGHKRIAYIGGNSRISTAKERIEGYKEALSDHGIDIDNESILEGDSRQESGERLTKKLLRHSNPPSALFTGNNMMTLGALAACYRENIHIPEQLSLVGYDDVPWAEALNPPATVIDQPGYEIGRLAAETLISRIQSPNRSPVTIPLTPKLVIRDSCGASKTLIESI